MPLITSSDPTDTLSVKNSDADYLIFYSSVDASNRMWCPDCRRVEDFVRSSFEADDAPKALIVYVGQREAWKGRADNPYRGTPWNVNSVPTIIKKEGARLVDDEITEDSLKSFIKA
ncbi:hypothetical protein PNOK_0203400 [Pyrrhoderma noxium]|uniref:Thioredoxin domain-containing protein n=1 Tax=Pyrrhoderma noxium TaxID=2282107 RepID=A0A286UR94_9AGAM|nr:hypothetical protein PNOK_0203400 [Pyrrhoderma noxium]